MRTAIASFLLLSAVIACDPDTQADRDLEPARVEVTVQVQSETDEATAIQVVLEGTDNGYSFTKLSGGASEFVFDEVPSGAYEVYVSAMTNDGHAIFESDPVTLRVYQGETLRPIIVLSGRDLADQVRMLATINGDLTKRVQQLELQLLQCEQGQAQN